MKKYYVGDLIVDKTTGMFGVILGLMYPYGFDNEPYYNVRMMTDDENKPSEQMMRCSWVDDDADIKWGGNYRVLVQQYLNYKVVVEDYLSKMKTMLHDDMASMVKQLFD